MGTEEEMKEIFEDAKKVQSALASQDITTKDYLHSIPVLLNFFYADKKELIEILHMLVKEATLMHDIMYKDKVKVLNTSRR